MSLLVAPLIKEVGDIVNAAFVNGRLAGHLLLRLFVDLFVIS
jgi:hypothetical protein